MKKIFFISYGGGHIRMLLPIIKSFIDSDKYDITVFGLTTSCSVLEQEGISYKSFKDFVDIDEHYSNFEFIGRELVNKESLNNLVSYEETVAYHGINYIDLKVDLGAKLAEKVYQEKGRHSFYPRNFFLTLFKKLKPDLVVTTNSPRSERAAIDSAGKLGISSICLVDLFALQAVKWIGQKGFASKVCVLNDSVKNMFVEHGRLPEEIIVTGNPAFDELNNINHVKSGALKRCLIDAEYNNPKVILYASQVEPPIHPFCNKLGDTELPRKIESYLRKLVEIEDNYHLIVRYHPSENIEFVNGKNVSHSPTSENLYDILHSCDLVIVTASTVGLQANLIGKKVISVDSSIFTDDAPFSKMGISQGVESIFDLEKSISQLLNESDEINKPRKQRLAKDKIISVIIELLKGH